METFCNFFVGSRCLLTMKPTTGVGRELFHTMEPMIELDEGYTRDGANDRPGGAIPEMEIMIELEEGYSIKWSQ